MARVRAILRRNKVQASENAALVEGKVCLPSALAWCFQLLMFRRLGGLLSQLLYFTTCITTWLSPQIVAFRVHCSARARIICVDVIHCCNCRCIRQAEFGDALHTVEWRCIICVAVIHYCSCRCTRQAEFGDVLHTVQWRCMHQQLFALAYFQNLIEDYCKYVFSVILFNLAV